MKMKKIVCSLMISVLCFMTAISGVSAASYDTSKIDNAYNQICNYYKENNTLSEPDQVIAVEALGLEAEKDFKCDELLEAMKEKDYTTASVGELTKSIISLSLMGYNPNSFNNMNLVEILENYVKGDKETINKNNDAGALSWILFALNTVNSQYTDKIASLMVEEDQDLQGGFLSYGFPNTDITGWAIEALTITNKEKYSDSISKAINYLKTQQNKDADYKYSNGDTQACVLEGLFVYDKTGVLSGKYNYVDTNLNIDNSPIDYLLSWMKDGYFIADEWVRDDQGNYYTTGKQLFNVITTYQGARSLGTYKNGSVYLKAQKDYDAIVNPVKEEPKTEPKKDTTPTQTTAPAQTDKKTTAVKTGDDTNVVVYVSLSMMSAGLFLVLKKEYERAH